ncbi:MAG: hypothetical protein ABEL51_08225 [Salinibacter sp.]
MPAPAYFLLCTGDVLPEPSPSAVDTVVLQALHAALSDAVERRPRPQHVAY